MSRLRRRGGGVEGAGGRVAAGGSGKSIMHPCPVDVCCRPCSLSVSPVRIPASLRELCSATFRGSLRKSSLDERGWKPGRKAETERERGTAVSSDSIDVGNILHPRMVVEVLKRKGRESEARGTRRSTTFS